jgi:hypothetical protein
MMARVREGEARGAAAPPSGGAACCALAVAYRENGLGSETAAQLLVSSPTAQDSLVQTQLERQTTVPTPTRCNCFPEGSELAPVKESAAAVTVETS